MCLRDCTILNCLLAMLCQNDTALGGVSVSLVQIGCILVASSSEILDFHVRVCFCIATCVTLVIRLFILVACPLQAPIASMSMRQRLWSSVWADRWASVCTYVLEDYCTHIKWEYDPKCVIEKQK